MLQYIIVLLEIVSDVLSILSVWGIFEKCHLWLKIVVTIIVLILCIMLVLMYDIHDIKLKSYYYDKIEDKYRVYTKKNNNLVDGSLVSIYYKYMKYEEKYDEFVAVGKVIISNNSPYVQIIVTKIINEKLLENIKNSNENYKNYHIRPNIYCCDI